MRLRTFTVSLVAAAAATLPLAGVASAQPGDRDCEDFSSQEEAQDALLPGDPERLDANGNGQACENYDYGSATPSATADPVDERPADEPEPTEEAADDAPPAATNENDDDDDDDADDDAQVSVVPRGGVDTGDGSSDSEPAPLLIGGVLVVGVAAAAARRRAHTAR
jgi:hypothetical protein